MDWILQMVYDIKLNLFENLNVLRKLSKLGNRTFPDDLCIFLNDELSLRSVHLFKENSDNSFVLIGKSQKTDDLNIPNIISISEYEKMKAEQNLIGDFYKDCNIELPFQTENLQSILFNYDENFFGLIILSHKILPSDEVKNKFSIIVKFAQNCLAMWNDANLIKRDLNIPSENIISKSIKGFQKEIITINGLLTLAKAENPNSGINKYLDQIRNSHQFISSSLDDLNNLVTLYNTGMRQTKSTFNMENLLIDFVQARKSDNPNSKISLDQIKSGDISFDENILKSILNITLNFVSDFSHSNEAIISSKIVSENNLFFSIVGKNSKLNKNDLDQIFSPFGKREILNKTNGLAVNLLLKIIELIEGQLKLDIEENNLIVNISIPIQTEMHKSIHEVLMNNISSNKDKILVIESDQASSALLNNYLSKWNYQTEIVNSGDFALKLLQQNKYVAVILNIEQENENSLEILQKIKNNKFTRNTPVIVFSLEAEKEKIYLMGSVEYLVKPINYNNLVEILTSYKLRRNSTVLCVDDDLPTLKLVQQAVQTAGFNVIAENRPESVIELISDKELDLAIVDLDMPKLNGFELIKQIKSLDNFSKLPIIIYTGKEDYQQDLQKIDGLFVDLLDKKSTSFNELEKTILSMINNYEEPVSIEKIKEVHDSPKILMAEDYKHSQIIVTRLLKKSGFENVVVVENGEDALSICKNENVDLILMDMQMPVMNGFEATQKIRELDGYQDTPIIALTAFAMKGDREKCLEAGATDYIPKPIDSKEFIEKVKYYTQVKIEN
ncbi:MAG: response regulator [Ignavibacteriae bacterium]|nr:response regulator [Ignavibacteriota bacterium]